MSTTAENTVAPTDGASASPKRIALVTCSTRPQRIGLFVTTFIYTHIAAVVMAQSHARNVVLETLDLSSFELPLYDEPRIPSSLPKDNTSEHYVHSHTRAWSAAISSFDAFIFVTPQYNWSVPAALKNALDYLFHEWTGKPAAVISYGGHGGGKSGAHLVSICQGLRMRPCEGRVEMSVPREVVEKFDREGVLSREMEEAMEQR